MSGRLTRRDPMERMVQEALDEAGLRYTAEGDPDHPHSLDFHLTDYGVAIEVKQMHSDRIARQMATVDHLIAAQGREAVEMLAALIRRAA